MNSVQTVGVEEDRDVRDTGYIDGEDVHRVWPDVSAGRALVRDERWDDRRGRAWEGSSPPVNY